MTATSAKERLMSWYSAPLSEKSAAVGDRDKQVVFACAATPTRRRFGAVNSVRVKVAAVQVVNVGGKAKRFGARQASADGKKAYVTLAAGSDIISGRRVRVDSGTDDGSPTVQAHSPAAGP